MKKLHPLQLIFLITIAILLLPLFLFLGMCFVIYGLIIKRRIKEMLNKTGRNTNEELNNTTNSYKNTTNGRVIDHE
ncbi:hypothetical protein [Cysteiniphilum halobium]|uniref:hypothetical protein n=1 Tax=Cysteiniphilum halobium TaxID=2219059 RepID=UPI000E656A30|nr:hypothetical protein [Cysteiniphilum halobium]